MAKPKGCRCAGAGTGPLFAAPVGTGTRRTAPRRAARNAQRSENQRAYRAGAGRRRAQHGADGGSGRSLRPSAASTFDVVSTSGAGSLAGLLWLAPKGQTPADALRSVVTMSISDAIYRLLPVNYKVFQKPGTWADLWRERAGREPVLQGQAARLRAIRRPTRCGPTGWRCGPRASRPSDLNWNSWGLCAPTPFIEHIIDFDRIRHIKPHFYLNAYNVTKSADRRFYQGRDHAGPFSCGACLPVHLRPLRVERQAVLRGSSRRLSELQGLGGTAHGP